MTDSALTHDDLIAGLHGMRLPDAAPGGLLADLAAAGAVGLLAGCVLALLFSLVSRPHPAARQPSLADRLDALARLPEADRTVELLHLLREHDPDAVRALRDQLYRRDAPLALADLEDRVRRHV